MQSPERRQAIIVLDFGSQYSRLITRRVRELHVYSELVPATTTLAQLQEQPHLDIRGFILSGGPASVYDEQAPLCDPAILTSGLPVLGICNGMQLLAHQLGGHVAPRSEEHTSELQSQSNLVCRLLLEKKNPYTRASLTKPSLRPMKSAVNPAVRCGLSRARSLRGRR